MGFFNKKKVLSDDYVELSVGRVYYKIFTNKVLRQAEGSCTVNGVLNNNAFITYIECALIDLSLKDYGSLSISDGQKIRSKTIEILRRHGLYNELSREEFNKAEKEWLDNVAPKFKK